jgi:hypothetical protein
VVAAVAAGFGVVLAGVLAAQPVAVIVRVSNMSKMNAITARFNVIA